MEYPNKLDAEKIIATISKLEKRIGDRFPESGLRRVCNDFLEVAKHSKQNIAWISKPHIPLKILAYTMILIGLSGLIFSITYIDFKIESTTIGNIVTITEAIFNDIVLLGAAIFFLISIETRVKRKKALKAIHELRVIAHVIDMHQLTKDPYVLNKSNDTNNSPSRKLNRKELQRYLDYCSEALSLIAKVAALYSQSFNDEGVVRSVNEIESLTTGLSRKIWQKIVILNDSFVPAEGN